MGLEEFKIKFDKPNAVYEPGQTVGGEVFLKINSEKKFKAIKVKISGIASVSWLQNSNTMNGRCHYSAQEEYLNSEVAVLGSDTGDQLELPSGVYTFPFKFELISNLPNSFESEIGYVRYSVKATINRSWKFDQDTKAAFTVIAPLDLNKLSHISEPIRFQESKTFCCLCCGSLPLTLNVSLPVQRYVPGQLVPVRVEVENQSGVDVKKVKIMLHRRVTYTGKCHDVFRPCNYGTGQNKQQAVILKVDSGPIGGQENVTFEEKLKVPALPPSHLEHCNIIDLEYEVKVEACTANFYHKNLVATTPVIIGTIPLFSYEMPKPPNETTGLSSNAHGREVDSPPSKEILPSLNLYSQIAPSSYEECMFGTKSIRDPGEVGKIIGVDENFAPRHPVYNF